MPVSSNPSDDALRRFADEEEPALSRCRAFVEQDAVGVVEVDAAGRFLLANGKFCEITGYTEAELLRMRFQDLTHPDDLADNEMKLGALLSDRRRYSLEKRYIRKDGRNIWVYLSVTRVDPPAGAPSVLAIVLDISEHRRAEQAHLRAATRYRKLFDSIDAGFCVVEIFRDEAGNPIDYRFVEMNAAFEQASGLVDAVGRRMRDLAPEHEQHWFDIYGRVAETGEPIRFEQEAKALHRWFSVYAFRFGEAAEQQVGILFEDITARRRNERRQAFLSDLTEKLAGLREERAIVEMSVQALGTYLDVDRCYFVECLESENRIRVGPNYTRAGTPSIEGEMPIFDFGGMKWWREYAGGDFAVADVTQHPLTRDNVGSYTAYGVRAYLVQPFKQKGPWTVVLAVTDNAPREWRKDESRLVEDVAARVWPLVERARSEASLLQAHAVLEERVAERTAKLQETISELESYSYSISHDLRAPLRAMQTYAAILVTDCGEQLSAEAREYLRRIGAAADRMDRLIRDVLIFSRIARAETPFERIELGTFIAAIIESYPGLSVATAEIELVSPLGAVQANATALTQCISNLLGNAIKFAKPGTKPRIRIWSERGREVTRLCIRDNGIGIAPGMQQKIFGMFYQIDPGMAGTGMGLAVVRKAAERMGGQVGVSSLPGEGSTFWLELRPATEAIVL